MDLQRLGYDLIGKCYCKKQLLHTYYLQTYVPGVKKLQNIYMAMKLMYNNQSLARTRNFFYQWFKNAELSIYP